MATPEMVERVAKALRELDRQHAPARWNSWEQAKAEHRERYLERAVAAIEAMRMEVTLRRGNIRENGEFARGMAAFGLELLDAIDAALRTPNGDRNE